MPVAPAALVPSWRFNPITPEAIANSGGLLTPVSVSVSLMIELTGGSKFSNAGLDFDGFYNSMTPVASSVIRYYQRVSGGSNVDFPNPASFPTIPALEFDTYICTAASMSGEAPAATPGKLNGTGVALIGDQNLQPTSGANRTGQFFNVSWAATPSNGTPGLHEIARVTFTSGFPLAGPLVPFPLQFGKVRDFSEPDTDIALPPFFGIPEPSIGALVAAATLMMFRRSSQRRRSGSI